MQGRGTSRSATHQHHNRGSQLTSSNRPTKPHDTSQALLDVCRLLSVTACRLAWERLMAISALTFSPSSNPGHQSVSSLATSHLPGSGIQPSRSCQYAARCTENGNKRRGNQLAYDLFNGDGRTFKFVRASSNTGCWYQEGYFEIERPLLEHSAVRPRVNSAARRVRKDLLMVRNYLLADPLLTFLVFFILFQVAI